MERIECCSFIITMKIFETDRLTIRTLDEDDIDFITTVLSAHFKNKNKD